VSVRAADEADLPVLLELDHGCAGTPHWSEAVWRETLASGRAVLVAELALQIVGFVVVHLAAGIATLESIAVGAEFRGAGVGRLLGEAALQWAGAQGAEGMELEVRASNAAALALYRSLGFHEQGRRRGYYAAPVEDAVLMGVSLPQGNAVVAKV
jgi:ribosomal-protein-alanine N-acetyltransferase